MNIKDVKEVDKVENKLEAIFIKQRVLMVKYHPIEEKNGLLHTPDIPVNLHDKFGQAQLKDLAWRFTEEIGEATCALVDSPGDLDHFKEELIDALHFLVELCILSGISWKDVGNELETIPRIHINGHGGNPIYYPIEELSRAMNCLKNKPWKQTHILTDEKKYKTHVIRTFHIFVNILRGSGMTFENIYEVYFKKNEVNSFRQRSKY